MKKIMEMFYRIEFLWKKEEKNFKKEIKNI